MHEPGVTSTKIMVFVVASLGAMFLITMLCVTDMPRTNRSPLSFTPGGEYAEHSEEPLPLKFDRTEIEFGDVPAGQMVHATFEFTNPTEETIEGLRVQASCGCTSVLLSEPNIPPGGSGKISAALRTAGFQGRQEKHISVTSAKTKGATTLALTANVIATVKVTPVPAALLFDQVPEGESRAAVVRLRQEGSTWPNVRELYADSEYLEVAERERDWREPISLDVKLKPGLKPGAHRAVVVAYLGSRVLPYITIPVKIVVVAATSPN